MDYTTFSQQFEQQQHEVSEIKIAILNEQIKLLPLKKEATGSIENATSWIDLSNEWFLKSRDMTLSEEERKLNNTIYEHYNQRSNLILEEFRNFLPEDLRESKPIDVERLRKEYAWLLKK